jgi:hypothetical protein
VDVLNERQAWLPELGQLESSADILSTFDVDDMPTEALMFQAGYLNIAETHHRFGEYWYQLRYPNQEVYQSLVNSLAPPLDPGWSADDGQQAKTRRAADRP